MRAEEVLKKFNERMDIKGEIREKILKKQIGIDDDYVTENFQREQLKEKNITKVEQDLARRMKLRKFRTVLTGLTVVAAVGTIAGMYHKGYTKGYEVGSETATENFESEHLRTCTIETAPDVVLNAYADYEINKYKEYADYCAEWGNVNQVNIFNQICDGAYENMKQSYSIYLDTGSKEDYNNYRNSAIILQSEFKKTSDESCDFSFDNSFFAYSILIDSNGSIIKGNPRQDDDYNIFIATDYVSNPNNKFDDGYIIVGDTIYKPYESETEKLSKSK